MFVVVYVVVADVVTVTGRVVKVGVPLGCAVAVEPGCAGRRPENVSAETTKPLPDTDVTVPKAAAAKVRWPPRCPCPVGWLPGWPLGWPPAVAVPAWPTETAAGPTPETSRAAEPTGAAEATTGRAPAVRGRGDLD